MRGKGKNNKVWTAEMILARCTAGPNGCIEWQGARSVSSKHLYYGIIHLHPRGHVRTHRLMWTLMRGPIPDGLWVLHRCDNPPCVNIDHLFLGTRQDNIADMVAKGRQPRNSAFIGPLVRRRHYRKISDETAVEILALKGSMRQVDIAAMFGISQTHVSAIHRGRCHRYVPRPLEK